MTRSATRNHQRLVCHRRLRKKVLGLPERPRLCVFRSHNHLYAQMIDDMAGKTLRSWSTRDVKFKHLKSGGTVAAAGELGNLIASQAIESGWKQVVFDRGGYLYHGRIKALADALRSGGVEV